MKALDLAHLPLFITNHFPFLSWTRDMIPLFMHHRCEMPIALSLIHHVLKYVFPVWSIQLKLVGCLLFFYFRELWDRSKWPPGPCAYRLRVVRRNWVDLKEWPTLPGTCTIEPDIASSESCTTSIPSPTLYHDQNCRELQETSPCAPFSRNRPLNQPIIVILIRRKHVWLECILSNALHNVRRTDKQRVEMSATGHLRSNSCSSTDKLQFTPSREHRGYNVILRTDCADQASFHS